MSRVRAVRQAVRPHGLAQACSRGAPAGRRPAGRARARAHRRAAARRPAARRPRPRAPPRRACPAARPGGARPTLPPPPPARGAGAGRAPTRALRRSGAARCAALGAPGAHQSQVGAEPVGAGAAAAQPRGAQDRQREQPADLRRRAGRGWGAQEGGIDRAAGLPGSLRAREASCSTPGSVSTLGAQPRQAAAPPPAHCLPELAARQALGLAARRRRAPPSQEGTGGRRRCAARPSVAGHAHWRTLRLPCQRAAGCAAPRGLSSRTCCSHSSPVALKQTVYVLWVVQCA